MSNCKIDSYTGVYGNYFGQNTYFTECEFSSTVGLEETKVFLLI
jgi:hypothetical protein